MTTVTDPIAEIGPETVVEMTIVIFAEEVATEITDLGEMIHATASADAQMILLI